MLNLSLLENKHLTRHRSLWATRMLFIRFYFETQSSVSRSVSWQTFSMPAFLRIAKCIQGEINLKDSFEHVKRTARWHYVIWKVCARGLTLAALVKKGLKANSEYVSFRSNSGFRFHSSLSFCPGGLLPKTQPQRQDEMKRGKGGLYHKHYPPLWMFPLVHFCSDLRQERKRGKHMSKSPSTDQLLLMCLLGTPPCRTCWGWVLRTQW